jgi:DNA-binding response OmpR family regulator
VLVVEDDRQISDILRKVLEKNEYHVDIYHDGYKLIETIKKTQPDIILLDISLQVGPDGVELCRMIKEDPSAKNAPIIMLTANEYTDTVEKCFGYGAVDYIFKPFVMSELLLKMKKYLRISNRTK